MNEREKRILLERLIPTPQTTEFRNGTKFVIGKGRVIVRGVDNCKTVGKLFHDYWHVSPEIEFDEYCVAANDEVLSVSESYKLNIDAETLKITAQSRAGALNAMKTLRQLAEPARTVWSDGTSDSSPAKSITYILPQCTIDDTPTMAFRGIHLCIFPETTLVEFEKKLRLAAYHKYNYAVVECWGNFPFESHPWLCLKDKHFERAELKRIIQMGRQLGITLVPQFNILGHAGYSRACSGKHATLDAHPEYQTLYEPDGWTWCLSNPKTRQVLTDVVLELYEFFDAPPYFHLGCDEAHNIATCIICRENDLAKLVHDHIMHFYDLLFDKAQVIIWHDMLLNHEDSRWQGYRAYGVAANGLGTLYQRLPKDIIIADWQYNAPENAMWPTTHFFHKAGFPVVVCPWTETKAILELGKLGAKLHTKGMLETTWNAEGKQWAPLFYIAPNAAWNPGKAHEITPEADLMMSWHIRQIGWDMELTSYEETGNTMYQVARYPHSCEA